MSWNDEELMSIVEEFENCGTHESCKKCICNDRLNSTRFTICDLLMGYREDLSFKISDLIDNM